MDNILVYHRTYFNTDPASPSAEFHSKKIKRQKTVGKRGFTLFEYDFKKRRFLFEGKDPMEEAIKAAKLNFGYKAKEEVTSKQRWEAWESLNENGQQDDALPF
jgi:hypothetical protein